MTSPEFLQGLANTFSNCLKIAEKKNADYANEDDPFKNFRSSEVVGVDIARAILVRKMDKLSRISNLLDRPAKVSGENILDSLDDDINYSAILRVLLKDRMKQ